MVGANEADLRIQGQYGVNYKQYWVDEAAGKIFCLVDASLGARAQAGARRPR